MRRELNFQKKIVAYVKKRGGVARVIAQTPYTTVGDPDVYGVIRGQAFMVEVKEPGERPTRIQLRRHREWIDAGADVLVVLTDSWERQIKQYIDGVL